MLGWIKKRCRRRSGNSDARRSSIGTIIYDKEISQIKPRISDCPVYFTIEEVECLDNIDTPNFDVHEYEEIDDVSRTCVSHDIMAEITSLSRRIEHEFSCKEDVCPLCRRKTEQNKFCTCNDLASRDIRTKSSQANIYGFRANSYPPKQRRASCNSNGANRPLPEPPGQSTIKTDAKSEEDSSGFYESVSFDSDSIDNQDYSYHDNALNVHDIGFLSIDDGDENIYEEINLKPKTLQKRGYSLSSLHLFQSPHKLFKPADRQRQSSLSRKLIRGGPLFKPQRNKMRLSAKTLKRFSSKLEL
ncbi:hypothetical protein SNE40_019280 [Patella caerulea]